MDRSDLRRAEILTTYWDDVALGRAPTDPPSVGGEVAELIERLQALGELPELDSARERVWHDVQQHPYWKEPDVEGFSFSANGAAAIPLANPVGWPRAGVPTVPGQGSRHWGPLAQAAIVLLVIASLIAGYFSLTQRGEIGSPLPLAATPTTEATPNADWPMYRGNPARTGAMAGPGPDGQPVELWRFQAQGPAFRSPAIAAGVAYLQSADGYVYALDAMTGDEHWRADLGTNEDTPAIAGDTLFINDGNGTMLALDAATGTERWRFAEPVAPRSTPIVVDGVLYAGSEEGYVYAIDAATGTEIWRVDAGDSTGRSLAVADGQLYVPLVTSTLRVFDAASGEARWTFTADEPNSITGTPTVAGDVVYVNVESTLYALDAADGTERWRKSFDGARPVSASDGTLYSAGLDGVVYALDAVSGEVRWTYATDERIQAAPALVGNTLYVASYDQTLYALDASTGQERWGFELDGITDIGPSVANGVLYISTDAGSLYALGSSGMEQMAAPIIAADSSTPAATATASNAGVPLVSPPTFLWQTTGGPDPMYAVGAVAIAPDGNLWVMDAGNNRFQIFTPDGAFLETWDGTGGGGEKFGFLHHDGGFDGDVAFDADGNIYVAESGAKRVQVFDPERRLVTSWGESGSGDGQFIKPIGLALDSQRNVYVLDYDRGDIQKFDNSGKWLATFGDSGDARLREAAYLTIDLEDTIWVADNTRILALTTDGTFLREIGSGGDGPGQFDEVIDVTVDVNGVVYVADLGHGWIQAFTTDGSLLAVWDAGRTSSGGRNYPYALTPDNQGNLYVSGVGPDHDSDSNVQKFALPALAP